MIPIELGSIIPYIPSTTRVFFIAQMKNIYPSSNNPIGPYISYPALRFCPKRLRYQLWLVRQNSAQPCGTGGVVVKLEELQQKWEGKGFLHEENLIEDIDIPSLKLTVRTWKIDGCKTTFLLETHHFQVPFVKLWGYKSNVSPPTIWTPPSFFWEVREDDGIKGMDPTAHLQQRAEILQLCSPKDLLLMDKIRLTTNHDDYPIIYRVLTIPGGAGFCPSTVSSPLFTLTPNGQLNGLSLDPPTIGRNVFPP